MSFLSLCLSFVQTHVLAQASPGTNKELVFASDTQAPMLVETILLKPDHNRTATRMVFNDILKAKPASVFLLGDVVNLGYSKKQWRPMDRYLQTLRDNNIPVHAVLGNHEVMGQPGKGQRKFQKRFPDHVRTGYVQVVDSIAVVMLNSNFGSLTKEEDAQQVQWYKQTLKALDADSSVLFVISGCHHSPFTNSKVVGSSKAVQQRFVQPFLQSQKSRLFLTGHCHGFEHFQVEGKDFMVIGGGGGLHQPLNEGNGALSDLAINYKPTFHYLTVKRAGDRLQVTSVALKKDFTAFDQGLQLDIPKATGTGVAVARTAD